MLNEAPTIHSAYCTLNIHHSTLCSDLPFQQLKFVDVDRGLGTIQGNDDGQPDRDFCCGDREGKEDKDLSCDIVEILRKGDEVDIRRVQHQFDRQQDDDDVPTKEDSDDSGQEHDAAQH